MTDLKASDVMTKNVITLSPDMTVKEASEIFVNKKINGAPVVDNEQKVVGIVTDSDLLMQDVKIHFPASIQLLAGTILLGSERKFEEKFKKAVGSRVKDVMTEHVHTAEANDSLEDVATLMAEKDIGRIPIIEDRKIIGIVTKRDIIKTLARGD